MKKLALFAAAALCVPAVHASELTDISASQVKASRIEVPAPVLKTAETAKCGHVTGEITKLNLLAQASKSQIFAFVHNDAEFAEFKAFWQPILEKYGMTVTGTEYKGGEGGFAVMKYTSKDGRVIRVFTAEEMNYDAKDPAAIAKLQHELLEPLERAGMTPIASFNINNEIFRPTFDVYYLTKADDNPDHEAQLRQLKNGDDIDFDLLAGAVQIVKEDASFSLVYIGRELGFKTKMAADEAGINAKLADYKKFLAENNKQFIASKTYKLDKPFVAGDLTLNYYVNMYFFQ